MVEFFLKGTWRAKIYKLQTSVLEMCQGITEMMEQRVWIFFHFHIGFLLVSNTVIDRVNI